VITLFIGTSLLIAAVTLSGCHSFVQYISPRVEGRVVDAQTHEPLADTRVEKLSFKKKPNPAEPPKGAQVLIQHNAIFTGADGTFVLDSQKAIAVFRSVFWYSIGLSFQHAGYQTFTTNYSAANATNTPSGTPLVEAGDILLVPLSAVTSITNSQATITNSQINPTNE
jgi:hypothetical protein